MEEKIRTLFKQYSGNDASRVEPLPVSGSARRYYRVFTGDRTYVGVYHENMREKRLFVDFTRHFEKSRLHVPHVYCVSEDGFCYLQDDLGLTYMFVTHDLSVVRHISHQICFMYLGQLVETCGTQDLFAHPLHPYSKALLSAIPSVDIHNPPKRILIKGELVSPIDPKPGCRFAARCPHACEACHQPQTLREVQPCHFVSCCQVEKINSL